MTDYRIEMHETLAAALPWLRREFEATIRGEANFDRASGGPWEPRKGSIDPAILPDLLELRHLIRRAEGLVGRQPDQAERWVNEIIDGRREL
jgi:hypothetical protein